MLISIVFNTMLYCVNWDSLILIWKLKSSRRRLWNFRNEMQCCSEDRHQCATANWCPALKMEAPSSSETYLSNYKLTHPRIERPSTLLILAATTWASSRLNFETAYWEALSCNYGQWCKTHRNCIELHIVKVCQKTIQFPHRRVGLLLLIWYTHILKPLIGLEPPQKFCQKNVTQN